MQTSVQEYCASQSASSYDHFKTLTPEIMHELVDKIVVHEPDKSSGKRVQDIEIHFRFDVAVTTISVETGKYGKKVA